MGWPLQNETLPVLQDANRPQFLVEQIQETNGQNLPAHAIQKAHAWCDLVKAWDNHKLIAKKNKKSETKAGVEFAELYSTGNLLPHVFKILRARSDKSIYRRAQNDPDRSYDYRRYADNYNYSGSSSNSTLPDAAKKIFTKYLLDPRQLKAKTAMFYTIETLKIQGIECTASYSIFNRYAQWLKKNHNDVWTYSRHGNKALIDDVCFSIMRDPYMLEVGQCLVADGHRLNFQIINPFTGKPCRATIIGYIDWRSYDLCGYEIMIEENTRCIASALRNAILYLGKFPQYTYQDNGKAFKGKYFKSSPSFEEAGILGLFAKFNVVPIFALPYNARAKVIEGWWKNFTDSFERLQISYIGSSIEDKPAYMIRNEKWHRAQRGEYVPDIYETIAMIDGWLALWRSRTKCPHNTEGRTVKEVMDAGRGAGVNIEELDELMMETKVTKIYANGIRFRGEYYWHEALYGKRYEEVIVRYSIFDKDTIRVYSKHEQRICTARRWDKMHPLANYLGTEADKAKLQNAIKLQAALKKGTRIKTELLLGTGKPQKESHPHVMAFPQSLINGDSTPLMIKVAEEKKKGDKIDSAYDLSAIMPEEPEVKRKIALFECELEDNERGLVND